MCDNPVQKYIDYMNEQNRLNEGKEYNIGMLLKDLEPYKNLPIDVKFDDGTSPNQLMSWRGRYNCLALEYYRENDCHMTASVFYNAVKEAIGQTFRGYKGGDFLMDENTPIYKANYGECYARCSEGYGVVKIVGIKKEDDKIIILTRVSEEVD